MVKFWTHYLCINSDKKERRRNSIYRVICYFCSIIIRISIENPLLLHIVYYLDENTSTSSFGPSGMLSSGSGITTNIDSSNFLGTSLQQNEINVSDEVKDMWEPPHTEPGIPPLLTMPGVHSPNDLVTIMPIIFKVVE